MIHGRSDPAHGRGREPIAVVGLGNLGAALGRHLVDSGYQVHGVDEAPAQREAWASATGLAAVEDLGEIDWATVDRVVIAVRLAAQVQTILEDLDHRRVASNPVTAMIVSTLDVDYAKGLGDATRTGVRVIESPVSGGSEAARSGGLTVMAAGALTDDDIGFLDAALADNVIVFSEFGQPTITKLLNNVLAAYNARCLAEIVLTATGVGLDPDRVRSVVAHSSGGSWITTRFPDLLDDLLEKDVSLAEAALGPLPAISVSPGSGLSAALRDARTALSARGPNTR